MKSIFIVFLVCMFSITLAAQTIIDYPDVSGVWTKAGSPYLIQTNISIESNDTLIIDPGVKVVFPDYYSFEVFGHIYLNGMFNDSIVITVKDTSGYYNNSHTGWEEELNTAVKTYLVN